MSETALILRARRLRAAPGVVVARDVSLTASPGDVVAVEGPNGSGKTTLLAAAAGLLPAGSASVRPGSVGYSPERAGVLPRITLHRWLTGLARTSGLTRDESARRAGDLMDRLGLAHASRIPLQALSRGNAQRALVAQALIADPDLLVLDEPTGGLDGEGVGRVVAEIERAAGRRAVVLVARHPTAPLPLPPGVTWRLRDGGVEVTPREADTTPQAPSGTPRAPGGTPRPGPPPGTPRPGTPRAPGGTPQPGGSTMEVETGDGVIHRVSKAGLPGVLRAALDAGLAIRRVQPVETPPPATGTAAATTAAHTPAAHTPAAHTPAAHTPADEVPPRADAVRRLLYGAAHRARLLASSQWFLAPGLLFLVVLGAIYATDAGPPLQAAAVTAIALVPVMTWLSVLAHRVEGRELARAFAAHAGGRARAHLATDLGLVPFALVLTVTAIVWPLVSQGEHPHPHALVAEMAGLHLAAAVFGAGLGSLVSLIERAGWRLLVTVAVFFGLFVIRDTPLTPLLRLSTNPVTVHTPIAGPTAWLYVPGVLLVVAAAFLAAIRLS